MQGRVISTLWVALLVWAARMAAIYGGSWMGAALGGTPTEFRLRVWQGMITQVGTFFLIRVASLYQVHLKHYV